MGIRSTKQPSVLVVDDDRAISRLIRQNLEDDGIRVIEAATGLDGIRILQEEGADLIILDLKLPDFNGWGILSLLRLTEPWRHIPVIMVSAEPPDTAFIKQLRPDDYIQKPFDIRDLLAQVKKAFNLKKCQPIAC